MLTYIVDSFTSQPFTGNPAGVCLLDAVVGDKLMQSIAAELNLSETAFVMDNGDGTYGIRYFSPIQEIPLCGHATLAASKVLFDRKGVSQLEFRTKEDLMLPTQLKEGKICMQFPSYIVNHAEVPLEMLEALGIENVISVCYNSETNIMMLEVIDATTLCDIEPDFHKLKASHDSIDGVLITAPSDLIEYDFMSRFFWPWSGGDEDPVTGATHTFMAPYWAKKMSKQRLRSYQCSNRGGTIDIELIDDHNLLIKGSAVIVFEGFLHV